MGEIHASFALKPWLSPAFLSPQLTWETFWRDSIEVKELSQADNWESPISSLALPVDIFQGTFYLSI
jgi:hypothetical protein